MVNRYSPQINKQRHLSIRDSVFLNKCEYLLFKHFILVDVLGSQDNSLFHMGLTAATNYSALNAVC